VAKKATEDVRGKLKTYVQLVDVNNMGIDFLLLGCDAVLTWR
jgi:hypothetical protein